MATEVAARPQVHYPESDGKPMAETDVHRKQMTDLIFALDRHFRSELEAYVAGNLLMYYEEGNPRKCVAPDVFVALGLRKGNRRTYRLWVEGKTPDVVIELTSDSTRDEDLYRKYDLYEQTLRVREYFLFDPFGDYLSPTLQGYRLEQGEYQPVRLTGNRARSEALGLDLVVAGSALRLYDPRQEAWLRTPEEEADAYQREAEARQREAEARQLAEAEVEKLRSELAKLRSQP